MNTISSQSNCPICDSHLPVNAQHVLTCSNCKNELEVIRYSDKVVSIRRRIYHPDYYIQNDLFQMITDLVNKNLWPEIWGFSKNIRFPNNNQKGTVIYDSEFCRIKFVLGASDYFPLHDTKVLYGRLHAPDNELYMVWNDMSCRCWHQNILGLTLPFLEEIPPQKLAENGSEIRQALVERLKVDYPSSDDVEYPLRLHSKIWGHYKEKLFSIFDLRNPELWEEYSKYEKDYRYKLSLRIDEIC